jgi:hypothetical protein
VAVLTWTGTLLFQPFAFGFGELDRPHSDSILKGSQLADL